jgi:hypothetical protein
MNQFKILPAEKRSSLSPLSSTEKTEHAKSRAFSCKKHLPGGVKMIEKGLILTGSDAELLCCALSEVKTKVYEESKASLDDTEALNALVSCSKTWKRNDKRSNSSSEPNAHDAEYADGKVGDVTRDQLHPRQA